MNCTSPLHKYQDLRNQSCLILISNEKNVITQSLVLPMFLINDALKRLLDFQDFDYS